MNKRIHLTVNSAKHMMKRGKACHPDYFQVGWSVVYNRLTDTYFDVNPETGSQHQRIFTLQDETCKWQEGPKPRR